MKQKILRILSLLIIISIIMAILCSCGRKVSFSIDDFDVNENTIQKEYYFDKDNVSEPVQINANKLHQLETFLTNTSVDYGYPELFNYEKALSGILINHDVNEHKYSALDQNKALTKDSLFKCVRRNNVEYLNEQTSLIKDIEDDEFLLRICEIIVDTTNDILVQYPDIDKERVYCNLGFLKIIEKTSALDFAAVGPGMVMHINRHTSQMVTSFTGSSMYNVLLHETIHILQYGCQCEEIDGCTRRCGLAHAYSEWEQDFSDWTWMAEGSAERVASIYANVEPMTYKNYVNYLLSLDLISVLREDIPANYVETIYFYDDINKLFSLFGADNENKKQEIYNMIYSLEIMQVEPADVKESYKKHYGIEWTDEIRDDINNKIKRPIVQTFTKIFYSNLINAISSNTVSKNDILFLVNLYESTINYHLRMNISEYDAYNSDFNEWYRTVQTLLFESFINISIDDYKDYSSIVKNKKINASMNWLNSDKQEFLVEKFEDHLCDFKFI